MKVLWSVQYRGSDPANCRRKVVRVLRVKALEEDVRPWIGRSHYVQFFSELEASIWNDAVVELLNVASRFGTRWNATFYSGFLGATTLERKVEHVESLSFELAENQKYRTMATRERASI